MEVNELEKAFTRLRQGRKLSDSGNPSSNKPKLSLRRKLTRKANGNKADDNTPSSNPLPPTLDDHKVYASDLVITLKVKREEAEEMIFIADLWDNQAIDFTEFKQIVVNWS